MAKRQKQLNLVIEFLEKEFETISKKIKDEKGKSKYEIELKEQLKDAIANLKLCCDYNFYADKIEIFEIPEGGSEGYFTGFNVVDEAVLDNIPKWAIKKIGDKEISLRCFDLVIRK